MFDSILIANRGEIACRIIRTAQRLGISTVAVYSDADSERVARHGAPTAAIRIGPRTARESYLNIDAIIEAALKMNARAIHPGYGFLSENASTSRRPAGGGYRVHRSAGSRRSAPWVRRSKRSG